MNHAENDEFMRRKVLETDRRARSPGRSLTVLVAPLINTTDVRRAMAVFVAMARLRQIVVDCRQPAPLARFWAAALEGFEVLPYDDAEIARLASIGLTPETDTCVIVVGPDIEFGFQQTDVADVTKKPMHVDIAAADRDAEVARLVVLGATVVDRFARHTWMRDPEGNDFCVTDEWER